MSIPPISSVVGIETSLGATVDGEGIPVEIAAVAIASTNGF